MTQTLVSVIAFLVLLALLPLGIRWFQRRAPGGMTTGATSRLISTLAVGPQQRVMTVEVGPEGARTWLVLGVTAQHISCLHTITVMRAPENSPASVSAPAAMAERGGEGFEGAV
jgi:flagellar protein FliO/FliZ